MAPRKHINDFPTEILQEIFLCVVSHPRDLCWDTSNPNLIEFSSKSPPPYTANYRSPASPYSSTHVCRKWKYVARSFPHLWTHLCILKPKKEGMGHLARRWLGRAGSLPLYLFLNEGPSTHVGIKAVLKSFIKHIHNWKFFQMETRTGLDNLIEPKILNTLTTAPALEHLSLTSYESMGIASTAPFLDVLVQSPSLRSLMVVCSSFMQFKDAWAPKLVNITGLKLCTGSYHLEELFDGLSYCQNLQRLGIYGSFHWTPPAAEKQLVLPYLTHLSVPATPMILTRLTLPSISGLVLTLFWYIPPLWSSVTGLVDRSRASLKSLKIFYTSGSFNEGGLIDALRGPHFERLRVLEVDHPLTTQTIKFLTLPAQNRGKESETGFLRHLQRLFLVLQIPLRDEHRRDVEQLMKSRLGPSSSITTRTCLRHSKAGVRFTLNIPAAD